MILLFNRVISRFYVSFRGSNTFPVDGPFEIRRCQNHRTESIRHPQVNNGIFPAQPGFLVAINSTTAGH